MVRVEAQRGPGRVGGSIGTSLQHEIVSSRRVQRARSGMECVRTLLLLGSTCVYRKPKPGHSGDEVRQGSGGN